MYAILQLQFMIAFQHGELLMCGPLLSPSMGHPIVGDFEESAQEPAVCFTLQPAIQPTGFSKKAILDRP